MIDACETHQNMVCKDMGTATYLAHENLMWMRRFGPSVAETIVILSHYRDNDNSVCCKAGRYARYLVSIAMREVTKGE